MQENGVWVFLISAKFSEIRSTSLLIRLHSLKSKEKLARISMNRFTFLKEIQCGEYFYPDFLAFMIQLRQYLHFVKTMCNQPF